MIQQLQYMQGKQTFQYKHFDVFITNVFRSEFLFQLFIIAFNIFEGIYPPRRSVLEHETKHPPATALICWEFSVLWLNKITLELFLSGTSEPQRIT